MKKTTFLFITIIMMASMSYAQDNVITSFMSLGKNSISNVYKNDEIAAKPRRSVAFGIYYTREEGTLFMGYDKEGSNRDQSGSFLIYPPFHKPVFYNQCSTKNVKWTINGNNCNNMMDPETGDFYYYEMPKTCLDEMGLSTYDIPVISRGFNSFYICDTNKRDGSANVNKEGKPNTFITCVSQPVYDKSFTFSDFKTNILYGGGSIQASTGDQAYIFGSGSVTFSDGTTLQSVGVAQTLPAPVSPFTAHELSFRAMSFTKPIAMGKSLIMEIRNVETLASGAKTYGGVVYETLVATFDDVSLAWEYPGGDKVYNVCFHKKEVDEHGFESNVDFVIDKEFSILVLGFDDTGIDCGVMGLTMSDEDEAIVPEGIPLITDGKDLSSFNYPVPISVPLEMWGYFDAIKVPTELFDYNNDGTSPTYGEVAEKYTDCNILRISTNGQQVSNEKWPNKYGENVCFFISREFKDEFGHSNYKFDAPEWVSEINVVPFDDCNETGMYRLTVKCQPLPEDICKRSCNLFILGSGVKSDVPIILLQGDADINDVSDEGLTPIVFMDATVKELCISRWDSNGDGELSMAEASAVIDIGNIFKDNTSITSFNELQFFTGLSNLGEETFKGCSNLVSINLPQNMTSIADRCFYGCFSLTSINIPNNVMYIGTSAFDGCYSLPVENNIRYADTYLVKAINNTNSVYQIKEGTRFVGDNAFLNCSAMTSITIPNSVTNIGNNAFSNCSSLTDIFCHIIEIFPINNDVYSEETYNNAILHVPYGMVGTYISIDGWKNFKYIVEMEEPGTVIYFENSTTKNLCLTKWDTNKNGELSKKEAAAATSLGVVFQGSLISTFDELQYFKGLTDIGQGAFSNSTVMSITLPENITSLGKDAFLYCQSLTSIHLPAKLQTIGQNALSGCGAMTSITVDEQNDYFSDIDGVLFNKDKTILEQFPAAKTTAYDVPYGTKVIARDAFFGSVLESVVLPTTLTELGYDAFGYSTKLTELTIPEGVTAIGDYILDYCPSLKTLRIPASVQTIGQRITNDCKAITDVYSESKTPFAINSNNFTSETYSNATLHVPYGTAVIYTSLDGWMNFQHITDDIMPNPFAHAEASNMRVGRQFDISVGFFIGSGRYNGYQFDLSLPEGFHLQEKGGSYSYELSERFNNDGMYVSITRNTNGSYRVLVYSTTNARIREADGELIRLVAVADKDMDAGEYEGSVFSAILSKSNGESIDVEPGPFQLVIPEYELGDVNADRRVDVTDVMLVVNHILGNTLLLYHGEYADMNGDGIVDVTDIMLIVSVILDPDRMYAPAIPTHDGLSLKNTEDAVKINVPFASDYTACQMTVRLTEGIRLLGTWFCGDNTAGHEVRTIQLPDGSWRIIVYSSDGAPLRSSDEGLLHLKTTGKGQVSLSDVMFTTRQCESVAFSDVSTTTGISDAEIATFSTGDIYDLGGRRHTTAPKQSGIYIRQGKAHTVRR